MHEAEGVWAEVCMHTLVRLQKLCICRCTCRGMCPSGRLDCMQVVVRAASLSGKRVCLCCV